MVNCWLSGLRCELLDRGVTVIEEWNGVNDDRQDVTTEQLVQGVARKGNERGADEHEKSLIWVSGRSLRRKEQCGV